MVIGKIRLSLFRHLDLLNGGGVGGVGGMTTCPVDAQPLVLAEQLWSFTLQLLTVNLSVFSGNGEGGGGPKEVVASTYVTAWAQWMSFILSVTHDIKKARQHIPQRSYADVGIVLRALLDWFFKSWMVGTFTSGNMNREFSFTQFF